VEDYGASDLRIRHRRVRAHGEESPEEVGDRRIMGCEIRLPKGWRQVPEQATQTILVSAQGAPAVPTALTTFLKGHEGWNLGSM
jgi:hypothetical protein